MPINDITVTRLKTFVLLGHSNADGWAPTDTLFTNNPHLYPRVFDAQASPAESYWENIYVATSAQPYPDTYHTPIASDVGDVQWLEMTIANTQDPADPHPHASPYQFPNNQGACYPHYYYTSYDSTFAGTFTETPLDPGILGTRSGLEIPFAWLWRHYWGEQVGIVKMAFSSTFMMAADSAYAAGADAQWLDLFQVSQYTPSDPLYVRSAVVTNPTVSPGDSNYLGNYDFLAWWTPGENFDWAPTTDRLYKKWYNKMVGADSALPAGTKMDVRLVILWMGDNEALSGTQNKLAGFKKNAVKLIDKIRTDLVDQNWTTLPKDQIPVIIPGVHSGYPSSTSPDFDSVAFCNARYDEIAKDDEMVRRLDPEDWSTLTDEGISLYANVPGGANHYGPAGYVTAANDIFTAWTEMTVDYFDALDQDEVQTVGQAIDQVRLYYSKSKANTDQKRDIVLQHLNSAMYHVFNHVGDNAWWLRRRMPLTINGGANAVTTLPRYVKRMLVIEDPQSPDYPIRFEQIGHADGGRMQILMHERGTGTYTCHFITNPRKLTSDSQIIPAPQQVFEWIVVEACRRLAAASSNPSLTAHYQADAMQLMQDCMRNAGQTQRSKNDVMKTQRRRPRFGYRRGFGRTTWGGDY